MKPRPKKYRRGSKTIVQALNDLGEYVYRYTVAGAAPGWQESPDGMVPPKARTGSTYTPPFAKNLKPIDGSDDKALYIGTGWLHGPKRVDSGDFEINDRRQYPFKPVMGASGGTPIDDDDPPYLTIPANDTTWIYLKVVLTEHATAVGQETEGSGTGADLTLSSGTGVVGLTQFSYSVAEGVTPPEFITATEEQEDLRGITYLPFGKITLDANGVETTGAGDWYVHHDYQLFIESFIADDVTDPSDSNPFDAVTKIEEP